MLRQDKIKNEYENKKQTTTLFTSAETRISSLLYRTEKPTPPLGSSAALKGARANSEKLEMNIKMKNKNEVGK